MYNLKERCCMCEKVTNTKELPCGGKYICEECDEFVERLLDEDCGIDFIEEYNKGECF